jgi:hypothetical protein
MKIEREEVPCCRVCHGESEPDNPLFYPCSCSGSIKYVHQECLIQWLKISRKKNPKCELCGVEFHFQNIYLNDAPLTMTIKDMIWELIPRVKRFASISITIAILIIMWAFALPVYTNIMYNVCNCVISDMDGAPACIMKYLASRWRMKRVVSVWYSGLGNLCCLFVLGFCIGELATNTIAVRQTIPCSSTAASYNFRSYLAFFTLFPFFILSGA